MVAVRHFVAVSLHGILTANAGATPGLARARRNKNIKGDWYG
jgi:hypothetical protein